MIHRHVYGLAGNVADNIHYVDETTVVYPAGHNVVLYNTEQKVQRHIAGTWSCGYTRSLSWRSKWPGQRWRWKGFALEGESRSHGRDGCQN